MRNGGVVIIGFILVGCGTQGGGDPAPDPAVEVVRAADAEERQVLVDLRDVTRAWVFDGHEAALPIEDALLICPNGAWMRLSTWLATQERELGFDLGDASRAVFALGAEEALAQNALATRGSCEQSCYQCPDGAWICLCPDASVGRDDPGTAGDGYIHPNEPYGGYGTGGEGGSGSSSGGSSGSSGGSSSGSSSGSGPGGESSGGQTPSSQPPPDL